MSHKELNLIASDAFKRTDNIHKAFRNRSMALLSHSCMLRGEDARMLDLADVQLLTLEGEKCYSPCQGALLVMRRGKRNQDGRLTVSSMLRAKNPIVCPLGALAFYLFSWFHGGGTPFINQECFPNFNTNKTWYDVKLFPGTASAKTEMAYTSHAQHVTDLFDRNNINKSKLTHVFRGSGAQHADIAGATMSDIERTGRWRNCSLSKAYLTSHPRTALQALAGFSANGDDYWIA